MPNSLTGDRPLDAYKTPGFVDKLFNVGNDGIMGMIKNLFQAKRIKDRFKDNKKVLYPLLALNSVGAGLASAVLIGVGAVTAGILKGTYDVFDGVSSILAEGIFCATRRPATSPFKSPHAEKFKEAGKTLVKGLAKFIVGSAIVAGIAMGGAGIAGVGVAGMLPVLATIGKVISIGMLSLSSTAGLGFLTLVINKVAKLQAKPEDKPSKRQVTVTATRATTAKNTVPPLTNRTKEGLNLLARMKNFLKKTSKEEPQFDSLVPKPAENDSIKTHNRGPSP